MTSFDRLGTRGWRHRAPALAICISAAACGARSSLHAEADAGGGGATTSSTSPSDTSTTSTSTPSTGGGGAGGSGGAGAAGGGTGGNGGAGAAGGGTGGNGGAGGAGGVTGECSVLAVVGPPAKLANGSSYHQQRPTWALASDDGTKVALLSAWKLAGGPVDAPGIVHHATFEPWLDFPSGQEIGPSYGVSEDGGASFAAARAEDDQFALLYVDGSPQIGGVWLRDNLKPFVSDLSPGTSVDSWASEALFVAQGPGGHLLGTQVVGAGSGNAYLLRAMVSEQYGAVDGPTDLACSWAPMRADAVEAGGKWLMAMSSGGPAGMPTCVDPAPGSPDEVQILSVTKGSFAKTDSFGAPGGATDVKMAPRPDGAWVVAGTPPGQVVSGLFLAARIDLDGKVISTFPIGGNDRFEIVINETLTAAGVGDFLAVAWLDVGGDKGPYLNVKTFGPTGDLAGHVQVFPDAQVVGAPALIGSPLTSSMLLAWAESPGPDMDGLEEIRVVRIDCVGSP